MAKLMKICLCIYTYIHTCMLRPRGKNDRYFQDGSKFTKLQILIMVKINSKQVVRIKKKQLKNDNRLIFK